jgi:aryl-alcohol dehydrogenase-like predicted oxidoreductase
MTATNPRLDPPGGSAVLAGRSVARIGFGAMQLPGPRASGPPRDRNTALAVLRRAIELGVNHIDTAQYYGPDVANELIHAALYPYPDELVLVSKVGAERDALGGWIPAQRPEQLRAGVEANLRSLAVERMGVVNLRLHDVESDAEADGQGVDLDSQLAEMGRCATRERSAESASATSRSTSSAAPYPRASPAFRTHTASWTDRANRSSTCAGTTTWRGCRTSRSARPSPEWPR